MATDCSHSNNLIDETLNKQKMSDVPANENYATCDEEVNYTSISVSRP